MGKTTFANTAPGPRLFLDIEGGTDWLPSNIVDWDPKNPPPTGLTSDDTVVVHVKEWDSIAQANSWLQGGQHEFKSVILDSITEAQKVAKRTITDGGMELRDWGRLYDMIDPVLRELRDLTKHKTNPVWCVVITALANEKDGIIQPDVQGSMARSLAGQIDTIGYLQPSSMNAEGVVGREMVVEPKSTLYAGDRTRTLRRDFGGKVPIDLDADDNLTWNIGQILAHMNGDNQ